MEFILREQNEKQKKLPKNVKFNKAFEVAKNCADCLKNIPTNIYDTYLDCFKIFAGYFRDGSPPMVQEFLTNPTEFEIVPR